MQGYIHSTETFGSVDGPGVRFIIFTQGCRMRCRYCHNPDTWALESSSARRATAEELVAQALRYRSYWGKEGGITVSGGEPLLQIDFLLELFAEAKRHGVHMALDTSGNPFTFEEPFYSKWLKLMELTDLVLLDCKHVEPEAHKRLTGQDNGNIQAMARELDRLHKPMWVRHVLVPGWTDDEPSLRALADFLRTLHNIQRIEVLPYHTMGVYKYKALGMNEPLPGVAPATNEQKEWAENILRGESPVSAGQEEAS